MFRRATARVLSFGQESLFAPGRAAAEPSAALPHQDAASLKAALEADRVRNLRQRFLASGNLDALFEAGELGIRRYVQAWRRRGDHTIAYDLSVFESSLLVEYGLRTGTQALLDEEGAKLLRFAHTRL